MATRIQEASDVGKILVSESVKLLAESKFTFKNKKPIKVKGFIHPINVFEVVEEI